MVNNNSARYVVEAEDIGALNKTECLNALLKCLQASSKPDLRNTQKFIVIKAVTIPDLTMQLHVAKTIHDNDIILLSTH